MVSTSYIKLSDKPYEGNYFYLLRCTTLLRINIS